MKYIAIIHMRHMNGNDAQWSEKAVEMQGYESVQAAIERLIPPDEYVWWVELRRVQ
jgi:hypothetical protein